MTAILGPLLSVIVLAQGQVDWTTGDVVDDKGKPVADAQVVFYAPPVGWGKENTAEAHAKTDA